MAGEVQVNAMLRRIPAKLFREWEAYYALEPFGEMRADYRAASICQILANINRGKDQRPYRLEEFVIKYDEEPKKGQSVKEKMAVMTVIARAWNQVLTEGNANSAAAEAVAQAHGVTL